MLVLFAILLFCVVQGASLCSRSATRRVINFDDVDNQQLSIATPRPCNSFKFLAGDNPEWPVWNNESYIMNVTPSPYLDPSGWNITSSLPNGLIGLRNYITVMVHDWYTPKTFGIASFKINSPYINNLPIYVNTSRNGVLVNSALITLTQSTFTTITLNKGNITSLVIACVSLSNCGTVMLDDFDICYNF